MSTLHGISSPPHYYPVFGDVIKPYNKDYIYGKYIYTIAEVNADTGTCILQWSYDDGTIGNAHGQLVPHPHGQYLSSTGVRLRWTSLPRTQWPAEVHSDVPDW